MTSLRPSSCPSSRPAPCSRLGTVLAILMVACAAWGPAAAAEPADEDNWTGRLQDPAIARKEAAAALVEGRRECARQPAAERPACLKLVQEEHAAALKRLGAAPARRKP